MFPLLVQPLNWQLSLETKRRIHSVLPWLVKISPAKWVGKADLEDGDEKAWGSRVPRSTSEIQLSFSTAVAPPKTREKACLSLLSTVGKGQFEKTTLWSSLNHCSSAKTDIIAANLGQRHRIAMWPWPSYSTTLNSIFLINKDNTHLWDCLRAGRCGEGGGPFLGMQVEEHS